jgi:hypothetical protein
MVFADFVGMVVAAEIAVDFAAVEVAELQFRN